MFSREVSVIFRQWHDAESSTYTYLLADEKTKDAVLIDTVRGQVERDLRQLRELGLELAYVLDTHTHADHFTAAGVLRARTGAKAVAGQSAAPCADLHLVDGDLLTVGAMRIRVIATPGHTDDSLSFLVEDRVFTGDALLIRSVGRTDFQNGNAGQLYDSVTQKLFALPAHTLVYPAHDYRGLTVSTIGEERAYNTRIASRSREEFERVMGELNLPKPRKIDQAVPANRACGGEPSLVQG
jgi:glyoxylase-like metal-dependent hydrolase (beta-lactamase superfamily II)